MLRRIHFLVIRRHFFPGTAIQDGDLFRAASNCSAGGVHGGVSSPHHDNLSVKLSGPVKFRVSQEIQGRFDALGILPRYAHLPAQRRTHAQEYRVKALLTEVLQSEIPAEPFVADDFHIQVQDGVYVPVQLRPGKAVRRNSISEHPPEAGHGLVNRDRMARKGQIVGTGQTCRASPHKGHPLPRGRPSLRMNTRVIGYKTLYMVDPDGFVHQVATASHFALSYTHPSANGGQGVAFLDQAESLPVVAEPRQAQISLDIHSGRAGQLSGTYTVCVVIGEEQRKRGPPGTRDPVAPGDDLHSVPDPGGAGGQQPGGVLDLHHAKKAGAEGRKPGVVAKRRDPVQLPLANQFQYGLIGTCLHRPSVDRKLDGKERPFPGRFHEHAATLSTPHPGCRP